MITAVGTPDPDEPAMTPTQLSELQEKIIVLPPGAQLRVRGDIKRISRDVAALLEEASEAGYGIAMDEEAVWIGFRKHGETDYAASTSVDIIDGEAKWVGTENE